MTEQLPRSPVTVRSSRYPALRQSGQASSNSGPIRSGALPAQGYPPVLAVDNASVRLARSHVHTGLAERLRSPCSKTDSETTLIEGDQWGDYQPLEAI